MSAARGTTSSLDDLLDESVWVNVQDPVRQMITAITKAVRTQSNGIRDLDRKMNGFVTKDTMDRSLADNVHKMCSKLQAADMVREMDARSNELSSSINNHEGRFGDIHLKLNKMNELLSSQGVALAALNNKVEKITEDVEELRTSPNYDAIYAYIDRQIQYVANDVSRKLGSKTDSKDFDSLSHRVKAILEDELQARLQAVHHDLAASMVNKEHFTEVTESKAEAADVHALAAQMAAKASQYDVNKLLNSQIAPLTTAIAALEKIVQIQNEEVFDGTTSNASQAMRKFVTGRSKDKKGSGSASAGGSGSGSGDESSTPIPLTAERVHAIIDEYVSVHHLADVTPVRVDAALAQHTEHMYQELSRLCDANRLECEVSTKEITSRTLKDLKHQLASMEEGIATNKDGNAKTRASMKQLASNVAKALAAKVGHVEMKKMLRSNNSGSGGRDNPSDRGRPRPGSAKGDRRRSSSADAKPSHADEQAAGRRYHYNFDSGGDDDDYNNDVGAADDEDVENVHSNQFGRRSSGGGGGRGGSGSGSGGMSHGLLKASREVDGVKLQVGSMTTTVNQLKECVVELQGRLDKEMVALKGDVETRLASSAALQRLDKTAQSAAQTNDWRIALGETSMNLRRELGEKMGREETVAYVRSELAMVEKKLVSLTKDVEGKASGASILRLDNDLRTIRSKIAGELTGGRWLWTTGQLCRDNAASGSAGGLSTASAASSGGSTSCWIPWDTEAVNAAPSILCWQKGATAIQVRMPGLYRLSVAVFTSLPCAIQLCLNGEPIVTLQPDIHSASSSNSMAAGGGALSSDSKYMVKRNRHSIGEVTCVCIDEHVSLPADGLLAVRYHSTASAQGFISLRKL